jgi:hypothetical protein
MSNTKENYHEASGLLHVPDHYNADDSEENKVIYALNEIREGTAQDVGIKISEVDKSIEPGGFGAAAAPILAHLYDDGMIGCKEEQGHTHYFIKS